MHTNRIETALTVVVLLALTSVPACHRAASPQPSRPSSWVSDITLPAETTLVRDLVPRRTTLDRLLRDHGVDTDSAGRIVGAMAGVFDPRRLKSLQPFLLERTILGAVRLFEYQIDADSFLRVTAVDHASSELKAEVLPIPKTLEMATATGAITADTSSLFAAMKAAGEADDLAIGLAQVFAGEIDFNSEVQPEDAFAVVFERFHREGRPDTYGRILAAEFHNDGRVVRAINFAPGGGEPAYYDANGRSLRRFFLKSPLKFEPRVTSGFSLRRMHPVLHTARAHRGVDYGAPHGAPVVAVASGTVVSASFDSTNGRMVRLKHPSGYQSVLLAPVGFRVANPGWRARQSERRDWLRRLDRPLNGDPPPLRSDEERSVRQPARRASQHAARRAGRSVGDGRVQRGSGPGASRPRQRLESGIALNLGGQARSIPRPASDAILRRSCCGRSLRRRRCPGSSRARP